MNWNKMTDEEVMTIATPIMDNLMQAAEDIDYARHIRDFSKDAKRGLGQEDFVDQCKGYQKAWGHFTDRELIGIIKKADHVRILWRQWCAKSEDQFMASLHLIEKSGQIQISDVAVS